MPCCSQRREIHSHSHSNAVRMICLYFIGSRVSKGNENAQEGLWRNFKAEMRVIITLKLKQTAQPGSFEFPWC